MQIIPEIHRHAARTVLGTSTPQFMGPETPSPAPEASTGRCGDSTCKQVPHPLPETPTPHTISKPAVSFNLRPEWVRVFIRFTAEISMLWTAGLSQPHWGCHRVRGLRIPQAELSALENTPGPRVSLNVSAGHDCTILRPSS